MERRKDDLSKVSLGTLGGPCVVPTLESERFEPRKVRRRAQTCPARPSTPGHSFRHSYGPRG